MNAFIQNNRIHLLAWTTFTAAAIVIGCGDGSEDILSIKAEAHQNSENSVVLADNVHVLPSDGSLVVTAFGKAGIQFAGEPVDYVEPGHFMVVAAPISNAARARLNHLGGFVTLADGSHIVPREMLPETYHAPGNEEYEYFLIHYAEAGERQIETGSQTKAGARAYAESAITRSIISTVAGPITHVATNGISDLSHAAKAAASAIGNEASSLASSVGNAIGDVTKIDAALSTLRSIGGKFKSIVKEADFVIKDVASNPKQILQDTIKAGEFVLTGKAEGGFSDSGEFELNLHNVNIERSGESDGAHLGGTFHGSLKYKHTESTRVKLSDYSFESMHFGVSAEIDTDIQLTDITGSGEIPLASYDLTPIVIDAGVPIVIIRELKVYARIGSTIPISADLKLSTKGGVRADLSAHSFGNVQPSFSLSGDMHVPGASEVLNLFTQGTANVSFHVTSEMKLYDVAGPYVDFNLLEFTTELEKLAKGTIHLYQLSGSIDLGASLEELGYSLAQTEKTIYSKVFEKKDLSFTQDDSGSFGGLPGSSTGFNPGGTPGF